MTDAEKQKMLAAFAKPEQKHEPKDDYWTDKRLIEAAKRIIRRLDLHEELQY